jgi:exodeoxyribonuclease VII large subunit
LKRDHLKLDAVCIVRGGGSATDLGWWNSYPICAAIANLPIPVITGIGHDQDRVAVDEVAHTAAPTPTAAAEFFCKAVRSAESEVETARETIRQLAPARSALQMGVLSTRRLALLDRSRTVCAEKERQVDSLRAQTLGYARRAMTAHATRLKTSVRSISVESPRAVITLSRTACNLARQIRLAARERLKTTEQQVKSLEKQVQPVTAMQLRELERLHLQIAKDIVKGISARAREEKDRLLHLQELVNAHDPVNVLRRGFSITLDAQGKAIKDATLVPTGTAVLTRLAEGQLHSTVTDNQ